MDQICKIQIEGKDCSLEFQVKKCYLYSNSSYFKKIIDQDQQQTKFTYSNKFFDQNVYTLYFSEFPAKNIPKYQINSDIDARVLYKLLDLNEILQSNTIEEKINYILKKNNNIGYQIEKFMKEMKSKLEKSERSEKELKEKLEKSEKRMEEMCKQFENSRRMLEEKIMCLQKTETQLQEKIMCLQNTETVLQQKVAVFEKERQEQLEKERQEKLEKERQEQLEKEKATKLVILKKKFEEDYRNDQNYKIDSKGFTRLHFAAICNSKEIADELISNGADINAIDIIFQIILYLLLIKII